MDRIREELAKPPGARLKLDVPLPVATFRTGVEQRSWVPTLHEWLEQEFKLNTYGRQSQAWATWCCGGYVFALGGGTGIRLDPLFKALDNKLKRRQLRKIREQIARELAALEAANKKANVPEKQ